MLPSEGHRVPFLTCRDLQVNMEAETLTCVLYRYPKNQRMARHLVDKTGCLEACQKRCEELAAILWIQLKINSNCRRGQKELFLSIKLQKLCVPYLFEGFLPRNR